MKSLLLCAVLLALMACNARAQFQLYLVNGGIAQPVVQTYNLGDVAPGTSLSVPFQITNISSAAANLDLLTLSGAGFSVASASAPTLPVSLKPQQFVDFTVVFQATATGIFSAKLNSVGIAVTLSATVPVELTYQWVNGTTVESLAAGPVTFGSVPLGQSPTIQIVVLNQTSVALTAPVASVAGAGFSLSGPSPGGTAVKPSASIAFEIQFSPSTEGAATGTLAMGGQIYTLIGTGFEPAFPQPVIGLTLPQPHSAEQGTVAVSFSTVSQVGGTGTVILSFAPNVGIPAAADPGIAFASGGQTISFNVFIGNAQANFNGASTIPFQTGTTAGVLTVTVQLGANTVQQSVTILPAVVGVTAVHGVRAAGTVEVDLTGFDNTRSAGQLQFTFYDAAGNPVTSPVQANGSSAFAAYFQSSAGGTFELKAIFPVLGDTTQIAAFQAVVTNSAGASTTVLTSF
jgi:hypothetical protein